MVRVSVEFFDCLLECVGERAGLRGERLAEEAHGIAAWALAAALGAAGSAAAVGAAGPRVSARCDAFGAAAERRA